MAKLTFKGRYILLPFRTFPMFHPLAPSPLPPCRIGVSVKMISAHKDMDKQDNVLAMPCKATKQYQGAVQEIEFQRF